MKRALILGNGVTAKSVRPLLEKEYEVIIATSIDDLPIEQPLFDLAISSPGIRHDSPFYLLGACLSLEIIDELEYGYRYLKKKGTLPHLIGVTGSNGKTTVVHLLAHLFRKKGRVWMRGNIGVPLSANIDEYRTEDYVIVECSSFQLEGCSRIQFEQMILTNLSPNHLDVVSLPYYYASKKRVGFLSRQPLLTMEPSKVIEAYRRKSPCPYQIKGDILSGPNLSLSLKDSVFHSKALREDLLLALWCASFYGLEDVEEEVKSFTLVPYRQNVKVVRGVTIVHDGKSTTLASLASCLDSFHGKRRLIILGGILKSGWIPLSLEKSDEIYVYGRMKEEVAKRLPQVHKKETLLQVLEEVGPKLKKGDVLIYSPAGSSFDQYHHYIERCEEMERWIKDYENKTITHLSKH